MTEVASLHVASRACKFKIIKSDQIFTIVYNKLKNDLRLPPASSVKELEQILQKLIKFEPGNASGSNETKNDGWCRWRCG